MPSRYLLLCLVSGMLCCGGCGDLNRQDSADLADQLGLAPEVVEAVAGHGSAAGRAFLADASTDRLISLRKPLLEARHDGIAAAASVLAAIDAELADRRGLSAYRVESDFLADRPDSVVGRLLALRREATRILAATDLADGDKREQLMAVRDTLLALGDEHGTLPIYDMAAILERRRGNLSGVETWQRRGIHHAERLGRLAEQTSGYGGLMMARLARGWSPAERDTLRRMIDLAESAGLASSTSFLISMQGYDAFGAGRYFTARTTFEDAIEICRRLGEPTAALNSMIMLTRMYAAFDCWDPAGLMIERAKRLHREMLDGGEPTVRQRLEAVQLNNLDNRRLAAQRRTDAAHVSFKSNFEVACGLPYEEASYVAWQWVEAMIDQEEPELVEDALREIARIDTETDLSMLGTRLPFWRAWLAWRQGRAEAAAAALAEYDSLNATGKTIGEDLAFQALALRAQLEASTDRDRALATVLTGWQALQARLESRERGTEAYLDLGRNPHLRWVAQELAEGDPALGYGLDLLWREAMLSRRTPLESVTDLVAAATARSVEAREQLAAPGALHCLFRVGRDRVVCWTVSREDVVREILPTPVDSLRRRTKAIIGQLSTDPGRQDAAMPESLARDLADLARDLLPPRLLSADDGPTRLRITGDGFLAQLPFAPLNVGSPGHYVPLVANTSIAWCRHGLAPLRAVGDEVVQAVGDPLIDAATRRRFALPPDLPGARAELKRVAALFPGPEAIIGLAATSEHLRAGWDTADVLYFVGHAVTDAQVPFASWLPLSVDDANAVYSGVGVQDILGNSFERCRVVVLSGCSTGLPYVDGHSTAPSLGDAFLDAGVGAAVQTFWPVRDDNAVFQPERIIRAWRDHGLDLPAALAAEQRRAMAGPAGIRHPFFWATWAVKLSGL